MVHMAQINNLLTYPSIIRNQNNNKPKTNRKKEKRKTREEKNEIDNRKIIEKCP